MKKPKIIEMIKEQVDKETHSEWRPPRSPGIFRGSELGDCSRAIQYTVQGVPPNRPNAELALLFSDGNLHHDDLRKRLRSVGTVTNVEYASWKKFVQESHGELQDFVITGTTDGIFEGDYVFDIKTINFFSFKAMTEEYLKEKYDHYIDQLNFYLNLFGKEWGFLLFKCKMTSALKIFWFQYDQARMDRVLVKLALITWATKQGKMLKKPFKKNSTECKRCPFRQPCWGLPPDERIW